MVFRVLVVCTGNICRSPYAEYRLRHLLADSDLQVSSAGTRAVVGSAMSPYSLQMLADVGVSGQGFTARQVSKPMVLESDLVLAMTREHRSQVVQLAPKALRTAYTVREVGRLLPEIDPDVPLEGLTDALRRARGRSPGGDQDDVADPYSLPLAAYEQMQADCDPALEALAGQLLGVRA